MAYPNQEIANLRKAGKLKEARIRAEELMKEHPDDKYLQRAFGWVIYEEVKACVQELCDRNLNPVDVSERKVYGLLQEYAKLDLLDRPDLLFSRLLGQLVRLDSPSCCFIKLLMWAAPNVFREEDFSAQSASDGTTYSSLAEKVALAAGRALTGAKDSSERENRFGIILVDLVLEEVPKTSIKQAMWLYYRKALLLARLGELDAARALLLPIVRAKATEWWAWDHWADLEEAENPELSHALLCQAALLVQDRKMAVKLYEKLARSFLARGDLELAKWAAKQSLAIRQEHQWTIRDNLRDLIESEWYQQASEAQDVPGKLARRAAQCKQYLYSDCPRREATYLGTFVSKKGKELASFALRIDGAVEKVVCPASRVWIEPDMKVGTPVFLAIDESAEDTFILTSESRPEGQPFDCLPTMPATYLGAFTSKRDVEHAKFAVMNADVSRTKKCRLCDVELDQDTPIGAPVTLMAEDTSAKARIVSASTRQEGFPFDCLMSVPAVVVQNDPSESAVRAYIDPSPTLTLPKDAFPGIGDVPVGGSISLKHVLEREAPIIYAFMPTSFEGSEYIKQHSGTYRARSEGFGFVDHVYVPRELAKELADGIQVSLVSVMHPDMKKKTMGWKAICVESITTR